MSDPSAVTGTLVRTEQARPTPGPWYASRKRAFVMTSNYSIIAEIRGRPEQGANAVLIAAAPDMLAALREIQVIAEGHVIDLAAQVQEGGPVARMELTRWSSVLAAIAKAEGAAS